MRRESPDGRRLVFGHHIGRVDGQLLIRVHRDEQAADLRVDFVGMVPHFDATEDRLIV